MNMGDQVEEIKEFLGLVKAEEREVEIWKFPLHPYQIIQQIVMPRGSFLLSVALQPFVEPQPGEGPLGNPKHHDFYRRLGEVMYLWAMVDPKEVKVYRSVAVIETGVLVSNTILGMLVGAVHISREDKNYVAHVFDTGEEVPK
jgi:hypothetical protein